MLSGFFEKVLARFLDRFKQDYERIYITIKIGRKMSFFTKILQRFTGKAEKKEVLHESDIKFSALIQSIQSDIVKANESLDCVGLKYIEQFFDKEPESIKAEDSLKIINDKFNAIEKVLDTGEALIANQLLQDLKSDVNCLNTSNEDEKTSYRPKMTSFEVPVFKDGVWSTKAMNVPLLALSPVQMPKIKELTFTSTLQTIQHEGEDVYVRIFQDEKASHKKKKVQKKNVTELKISITPEQSSSELNDVITHYEELLRTN